MYWRKIILFTFIVLLPSVIVGISTFHVFPDSSLLATLMLIVTVGIAGVFTYCSSDATARIRRYCIAADVLICAILCVNLGGHWILAREVSASRQGLEERHTEEDREDRRRTAEAERQLALKQAEADLLKQQTAAINADRRRLVQLLPEQRRSALNGGVMASKAEAKGSAAILRLAESATPEAPPVPVPRLTPEQVREKWWWFLTALAIAECAASVLAGAILAGVWEWDRDHDGVPDHLQNLQQRTSWPQSLGVGK
jgi:hypothetical protein